MKGETSGLRCLAGSIGAMEHRGINSESSHIAYSATFNRENIDYGGKIDKIGEMESNLHQLPTGEQSL